MARNHNRCPHMENVIQLSLPELCKLKQGYPCSECNTCGPNLWICLHRNCLRTGCSEQANDHSTEHFKLNQQHCIHMNLSSQRIWCYLCETEVFLSQRRSSLVSNDSSDASRYSERIYEKTTTGESPETSCDEEDGDRRLMDGLVGLQNIANTCYMNAALQALSNSPPLTYYFLDCGDIIEATSELSSNQRKPGLAKSYHRLIKDMWCRNKRSNGYVVPRGILYGIRNVHPMFRGFQQHDTQEFLRCFMDQLHEELKEVTPPPPDILFKNSSQQDDNDDDRSPCSSPSPSQSEAEYETCDSGVSEQSSLSDEGPISKRFNRHYSRSPSPAAANQRNNSSSKSLSFGNNSSGTNNQNSSNSQKEKSPPKPPHRSIISEVFDGKLLSSVQCLTCDRISTREETFQDLSLPIPGKDHLAVLHQSQGMSSPISQPPSGGVTCTDAVYQAGQDGWFWWIWNWLRSWFWGPAVSLHDCMAAFFSADELKGDNMYSCEKCNKLRNGIKYSRVLALPEMLCVHLKRFRHDLSYSSKISSPVHFPLTGLDMRPYLHKDCKSEISTYDLTAVICHHGTVGGGHYTSFAKHELTGKWFEFDDQLVTEVTPEVVQTCQAYVLFYRKSNPQMAIIRAQAQELADSNPPQASDIRFYVSRQWINRFNTFAEPGPIDNWAILCPHGGLPPCKAALISRLAVPLPQPLWDFLYQKFGGGPACNRLFECDTCRRAAESLSRRQKAELEAFTRYNDEFQYQEIPTTIYAISMAWFRQWQLFARGVTTEEPGPINNTSIAAVSDTVPIRNVRPGSDYAQMNSTLWKFFHGIYGGGPEIILRGGPNEDAKAYKDKESESMEVEQDFTLKDPSELFAKVKIHKDTSSMGSNANNPQKITKNVSFEDEAEEQQCIDVSPTLNDVNRTSSVNEDDISSQNSSTTPTGVAQTTAITAVAAATPISNSARQAKRGKYNPGVADAANNIAISPNTHEIIGKKDRKYRGAMKSSGFFGPEGKKMTSRRHTSFDEVLQYLGKYYTQQYDPENIPESIVTTTQTTTNSIKSISQNPSNISNANYPKPAPILNSQIPLMPLSNSNSNEALKRRKDTATEESTPLLHQATTTTKPMKLPDSTPSPPTPAAAVTATATATTTPTVPDIETPKIFAESEISVKTSPNASKKSSPSLQKSGSKTHHRKKAKSKSNRRNAGGHSSSDSA